MLQIFIEIKAWKHIGNRAWEKENGCLKNFKYDKS